MKRPTRLVLLLVLALVVPGISLAVLGFRALRAEEIVRRSEAERLARAFAHLAAEDLANDLRNAVVTERDAAREALAKGGAPPSMVVAVLDAGGGIVWPPSFDEAEQDLLDRITRERPDLAPLLSRAEAFEFRDSAPSKAAKQYVELAESLESPATRARLLYRAARCAFRSGDRVTGRERCGTLVREYGSVRSESGIPYSVVAKLQLLSEVPAEGRRAPAEELAREIAAAGLPPDAAIHLLQELGPLCPEALLEDARARLRILRWARADADSGEWWLPSGDGARAGWTFARPEGGRVVGTTLVAPFPRVATRQRLEELARLQNVSFSIHCGGRWVLPELVAPEFDESLAGGTVRLVASIGDPARLDRESRSRRLLLGGLLAVLVLAMSLGGYATVRSVQRELRLAQLKSDFVSNVSHELRTPLTSIRMFSELLAGGAASGDAPRREYVEILKRETARLSALVERILESARLHRGREAFRFEPQDLRNVVGRAVESFRSLHPDVPVRYDRPELRIAANVDGSSIEQVLHNLLDNAAKYTPLEPRAELTLGIREGRARIEVRDFGVGIDPADLPGLFQDFRRGSHPITLKVPGTGLGLALVRRIVDAHGGSVSVASAPGKGSTFTIEIPTCPES